jgi:hypothetical protein
MLLDRHAFLIQRTFKAWHTTAASAKAFVSILVIAGVAWSLLILYRIFVLGAWPTYLPHVAIGGVVIIVITQTLLFRRTRHEVA